MNNLPIYDVLEELKHTLTHESTVILQAPPGAGKSTVVPISFLEESWLEDKMIIMLEPRRVAARSVATHMAKLLGEEVGQRVGYQVKMESCYSKQTKLLVVTEAILVRKLQSDQSLEDVALIIFDEFHERSIHTDLSLAFSLQSQALLRDDLKLLIMSATLNVNELLTLLGEVPVITSEGKAYKVENIYLEANVKQPDTKSLNQLLLDITLNALEKHVGDILVFLPGAKEINKLQTSLQEKLQNDSIEILPLYSALSKEQQDRAINVSNKRKVILSTNLAQTSLTIEGVKVVIDTGLEKQSSYHYDTGMDHLNLTFISNDSAIQRAGRAGRLSEGTCYRLWHQGKILQQSSQAEILRVDLSSFYLDIALWGVQNIEELDLLNYPSIKMQQSTQTVLQELHMLDEKKEITPFGKKALALGVHPRFAYMILKANEMGFSYEACLLSAMLSEKDIFKKAQNNSDVYARFIHLYEKDYSSSYINGFRAKAVIQQAQFFYNKLKKIDNIKKSQVEINEEQLSILLLFAYPDRLAKQRAKNDHRYKLSNGKGAMIHHEDTLFNEPFLITPVINAQNKDSYINLALRVSLGTIEEYFEDDIQIKESIIYNKENKRFDIRQKYFFNALELYSQPMSSEGYHDYVTLICALVQEEGLELLTWSKKAYELQHRVNFINEHLTQSAFPEFDEESLLKNLDEWLKPYLEGISSIKELESLDLYSMLLGIIPWELQQELDKLAPTHIKVPSGSNIRIDYSDTKRPILAVKIQEVFGLSDTPRVLNNTIALQMHLLSPALRPIQITYDLKSFWENSYAEVKKELFSKYKKHYWPDNPFEAIATNKTKKNMNRS